MIPFNPILSKPVCRPTLTADIPEILEITRHTWQGHDYVPLVLDQWIRDTSGAMFTAELAGTPVGIVKLSLLGEKDWWIEGLRVNQSIKNRGIGKHLFGFALEYWKNHCSGTLRMITGEANTTSQHLAGLFGFEPVLKFQLFSAPPDRTKSPDLVRATPEDTHRIYQTISEATHPLSLSPYLDSGWAFNSPDFQTISRAIQGGHVWITNAPGELVILHENMEREPGNGVIQALTCEHENIEWMLVQARRITASLGWIQCHWMVPEKYWAFPAIASAGFLPNPSDCIRLYEYFSGKTTV
jgi:GNAT superfamily N-acetyltransferase